MGDVCYRARSVSCSKLFVIGGAEIYEQFLPLADTMILTEMPIEVDGDTYFPAWDQEEWLIATRRPGGNGLVFTTYRKEK